MEFSVFVRKLVVPCFGLLLSCGQLPVAYGAENPEKQLARFANSIAINPIELDGDPYLIPLDSSAVADQTVPGEAVCAVRYDDLERTQYTLETFPDAAAASQADAFVTHHNACGTCSTLQDLAVYLRTPNLTSPVRRCAALGVIKPVGMSCVRDLGFGEACAETWYYNTRHTRQNCTGVCLMSWLRQQPLNLPNGELNACLACDEVKSGPVFKRTAGRTRRNSGIESAIGRQAGDLVPIRHDY